MGLEETLTVLNAMQADRIIGDYAIGGAVAAFFYIEPGTTFDLDVFMAWEPMSGGLLNLGPIYTYLAGKGYLPKGEAITIAGWEVQFLPPASALVAEALEQSLPVEIGSVATKIFTREHLMAICLETNRPKDIARLVQFVEDCEPDEIKLGAILDRYHLKEKWTRFQKTILNLP